MYIQLLLLYVAPSLFCLISIVGVIGNSFVIYVIASTPHMRSSATNILLLNLAVADLYFLIVCAPFMAYKYATVSWPFGDLACKLVGFSTYTSSYVTVYTLVAISALRYKTISLLEILSCRVRRIFQCRRFIHPPFLPSLSFLHLPPLFCSINPRPTPFLLP